MAIEMRAEIQGATKELYEQGFSQVKDALGSAPGFIFHFAGPMEGGYRVVEVWETEDQLNDWIRNTIMPMAQRVGLPPFQPKILPADNYFYPA